MIAALERLALDRPELLEVAAWTFVGFAFLAALVVLADRTPPAELEEDETR